ncbi:MAG: hypothetical protein ABEH64_11245 [Salinirussus sp.]
MRKTDAGTSVGVDDPYDAVDRCDYLTDEGRCRFAIHHADRDHEFHHARRQDEFRCPVAGEPDDPGLDGPWTWADCQHFRSRTTGHECVRCGLEEIRLAHDDSRPLLEEHHLSYATDSDAGAGTPSHEITVTLCRWCHAKVHDSWASLADDVNPDPEAIAAREERRAAEQAELGFETAADRRD